MKILTSIVLYICITRILLFILLEFRIIFYAYWRRKITYYAHVIDKS